jgi:hypothetical protein
MYFGASHVLVMRDGKRLMICFVRFGDEGYDFDGNNKAILQREVIK